MKINISILVLLLTLLITSNSQSSNEEVLTSSSELILEEPVENTQLDISSVGKKSIVFGCNTSFQQLLSSQATRIQVGNDYYFIGYRQVSPLNKDPILVKFTNGLQQWCRSDYETTNDDGSGYGLLFTKLGHLYATFTSTGTQPGNNFGRFARNGWFNSYGFGGGPKISIVAKISPLNGNVELATFIRASSSSGRANSVVVSSIKTSSVNSGILCVKLDSWFSPVQVDKRAMNCTGSSPFDWRVVLDVGLNRALSSCVVNSSTKVCSVACVNDQYADCYTQF